MGKIRRKLPTTHYQLLTTQKGFSPLLLLLPLALVFVVTVFLIQQGKLGQSFLNQTSPRPASSDLVSVPQLDDEACNDQYNADCYVGDDEGDDVRAEDLIGPD